MNSNTTTPKTITEVILQFCYSINEYSSPLYIKVQPQKDSKLLDCYNNVDKAIEKYAGKKVLGWIIWRYKNIILEAEAHAVWKQSSGEMIDVTPQRDGERNILFLPDANLIYNGMRVGNRLYPLSNSLLVAEYIDINKEINKIISETTDNYVKIPSVLLNRHKELTDTFNLKVSRNDPCPCGSGKKFKKCCDDNSIA